jgi:hypothetical protein
MIKLTKKAIELLDAVTSDPYSRKGLGYTIGRGLDADLPFFCYSDWFSCYFDQKGKLMKALKYNKAVLINLDDFLLSRTPPPTPGLSPTPVPGATIVEGPLMAVGLKDINVKLVIPEKTWKNVSRNELL